MEILDQNGLLGDAMHFGDEPLHLVVREMVQEEGTVHEVKRVVGEWQAECVGLKLR